MPKCNKIKNPCKICLEPVSNRTGLQCQGACRKWVHFACLHYTPGKISDIKKGILKVTCPCPDCKTTAPKEYRTDDQLNCTNTNCPSNLPRSCVSTSCPSNMIDGCLGPLKICRKDTCKENKVSCPVPLPPSNFCLESSSSGSCPESHVSGDTRSSGEAIKVMEQICTAVGELSNQINCLMKEMKGMKKTKSAKGARSGNLSGKKDTCCQPQAPSKAKSCNCPDNPSSGPC